MFHDSSRPAAAQADAGAAGRRHLGQVAGRAGDGPLRARAATTIRARIVRIARDWARESGLPHVYDSQGICHVVLPQHGHIRPGMFCVGGDSHSPTGGAFGAYMFGIGSTEMLGVVVTGEIWLRVPQTIRMRWDGRLAGGRLRQGHDAAHDRPLRHERRPATRRSSSAATRCARCRWHERMTLSNMSAELGAQAGLVAPDATTRDWLAGVGRRHRRGRDRALAERCRSRRWRPSTASTPRRWRRRSRLPHSPANAHAVGERRRRRRSTWPTSAPAPAPSSTTCAPRPACCAATAWRRACG